MSEKIYARLRPYDKKGGQPHRDILVAHLNMKFVAGKFMRVPDKIKGPLTGYLAKQYPNDDRSRTPLYEIVNEKQMFAVIDQEARFADQERRAMSLGIPVDELRRRERDEQHRVIEYDRQARLKERGKSELEQMAEDLGEEGPSEVEEIAELQDSQEQGDDVWEDVIEELVDDDVQEQSKEKPPPKQGKTPDKPKKPRTKKKASTKRAAPRRKG